MRYAVLSILLLTGRGLAQLAPKKYIALPLGSTLPSGWLSSQLQLQANGLAGHEHEFYNYVSQTTWLGGNSSYSDLEEAGSYWFNGIVGTGVVATSDTLKAKAQSFLDYVIGHQDSTGWLGPEVGTSKPRYLWGRYPFLLGAIQMVEANPNIADQVIPALHKFVNLAHSMIVNNQGLEVWTRARWHEFAITLQWLYDVHPNGNEAILLDTMQRLKATGFQWDQIFSEQYFPKTATEGLSNPFNEESVWHGVNVAEGLKASAVAYRFTHNQSDLDAASSGWDRLFQYHGRPSGIFGADEFLAGMEAVRGSELCMVVELMFSGSYLYQVIGDIKFADRIEKVAYNALPATLTANMWSRQYLQQQNQIAAKNMNPDPFPRDGSYSNVFGLEPNYPCCTVNFPQGWAKFVSNAFLATPNGKSLIHLYLGPFSVKTTLAGGNNVAVTVDTAYPFSDTLTTTVTADKAFTYYVRIPSWVVGGTIAIGGGAAKNVDAVGALQAVQLPAGKTSFVLNLPAKITTESRPHGAVAVHRGPLNYAFDISRKQTVLSTSPGNSNAVDLQYDATESWQYAIDPSTLQFNNKGVNGALPSPIFDYGLSPLSISAKACLIDWSTAGDTFAAAPPQDPVCQVQNQRNITLWPFGATKLRIGEFPTFPSV
ncbi:putative beta-L-arabinofuranosidase, GH127 [Lyophyllum shimeji]|uniref:Beta-L-arabinofuranosidase, GH127 n=1 Tax=Lyophyllum shimeji TaxID=47721 RepID=A0A9P3PCZ9_LYOSH|nr:putative beta-L-arabinofuranosidase, GH127 [Lyophyllum shimeji]